MTPSETPSAPSALERMKAALPEAAPFIFAALLLAFTLGSPPLLSFDEFHYVPAAKELFALNLNRNWEHPPLGKFIMGASWSFFHVTLGLLDEFTAFRLPGALFALLALGAFRRWLRLLRFPSAEVTPLVWCAVFNMVWYVQAKTAMLDMYALALALWGLAFLHSARGHHRRSRRFAAGWALLALAMASKWSSAPFVLLGLWETRRHGLRLIAPTFAACAGLYAATFLPLAFLHSAPMPPSDFIGHQLHMVQGLESTSERVHAYRSSWWQWLTLHRPMWYTFSKVEGAAEPAHYTVFMGGNPVLFILGGLAILYLAFAELRRRAMTGHGRSRWVLALFIMPLAMWVMAPRKLMFFYYVLPSSLWYGPAVALALENLVKDEKRRMTMLWVFTAACGIVFFYMLPVMAGKALPYAVFQKFYQPFMWRLNWI